MMMYQSQFIEMFNEAPIVKLGDHIDTQSGGTPNTKKAEYYEGGDIPWLSSGEVNQGYINGTEKFITKAGLDNSSAKWSPEHSIVIAMYGATAGKVGYLNVPVTTNQAVCTLLPSRYFVPKFLYYAVSNKSSWMVSQCQGAAQPNISQGIIRKMEIPMPEKSLQEEFVLIVEQADKSKFGNGFKSQFIEMFGEVSDASPCLSDIAKVYDGTHKTPTYTKTGIPFISVENIGDLYGSKKYISEEDYARYKYKPEYGDVFMTRIGSIGKCAVYESSEPLAYYVSLALIKPNRDLIQPKFLKYYIESNDGTRELMQRSLLKAFPMKINLGEIGKIKVIVPPFNKQTEFVRIAEQADKSKSVCRQAIKRLVS